MNKQEVINKLQSSLYPETSVSSWDEGYNTGITQAIRTVTELDKLDKEVVPQFVAYWYEDNQDDFEFNLYRLCVDYDNCELDKEMMIWFRDKNNKPIETLVMMHKFGYEVKKEKLYRAKNRHTGEYLCYCFNFFHDKNSSSENQRFTAEEKLWKELGYWGNDLYIFEEVKVKMDETLSSCWF